MTGGSLDGRIIRALDMNANVFRETYSKLPKEVILEVQETIKSLLFKNIDELPRKLHFHQLNDRKVPSRLDEKKKVNAWSLHITADDRYKASFTFENGTIYFRICGKHDSVDKAP